MARHQFRSQPTLQRSGGRAPFAIIGLCLIAGAGLGLGAIVGTFSKSTAPGPAYHVVAGALDKPAVAATGAAVAPEPQVATAQAPGAALAPSAHLTPVKAKLAARPPHKAQAPAPAAKPLSPQEQWERQRHDYEIARAAYDASERSEGFRWAQQNRIRLPRYCRTAEQRDPAFVEGCMSYLNPAQSRGADRPHAAPETDAPDQG